MMFQTDKHKCFFYVTNQELNKSVCDLSKQLVPSMKTMRELLFETGQRPFILEIIVTRQLNQKPVCSFLHCVIFALYYLVCVL